ncbi:MAG: hypothetical protein WBA45_12265 [Microthrixaceae bacterium]
MNLIRDWSDRGVSVGGASEALIPCVVLVISLAVVVRSLRVGIYASEEFWALRGIIATRTCRISEIRNIEIVDEFMFTSPTRVLRIDLQYEQSMTYRYLAWQNQLGMFLYGSAKRELRPRQQRVLGKLRSAAGVGGPRSSHRDWMPGV